jgi:hypothetical protein
MTANERETLGRRAVACNHWRWMPGMRTKLGTVYCVTSTRIMLCYRSLSHGMMVRCRTSEVPHDAVLPDLGDPATIGCLLALVRESLDDALIKVSALRSNVWAVQSHTRSFEHGTGYTEAEALVSALEAAQ